MSYKVVTIACSTVLRTREAPDYDEALRLKVEAQMAYRRNTSARTIVLDEEGSVVKDSFTKCPFCGGAGDFAEPGNLLSDFGCPDCKGYVNDKGEWTPAYPAVPVEAQAALDVTANDYNEQLPLEHQLEVSPTIDQLIEWLQEARKEAEGGGEAKVLLSVCPPQLEPDLGTAQLLWGEVVCYYEHGFVVLSSHSEDENAVRIKTKEVGP